LERSRMIERAAVATGLELKAQVIRFSGQLD
jgi:hypothetical protein